MRLTPCPGVQEPFTRDRLRTGLLLADARNAWARDARWFDHRYAALLETPTMDPGFVEFHLRQAVKAWWHVERLGVLILQTKPERLNQ